MSRKREVYTCKEPRAWNRFLVMTTADYRTCECDFSSLEAAQRYVRVFGRDRITFIEDTLTGCVL